MLLNVKKEDPRQAEKKLLFRIAAAAQAFRNDIVGINFYKDETREAIMSVGHLLEDLKKRTRK